MAVPKLVGKVGVPLAKAKTQDHQLQPSVHTRSSCSQCAQSVLLCTAQLAYQSWTVHDTAGAMFLQSTALPSCACVGMGSSCTAATLSACHALCGPPSQAFSSKCVSEIPTKLTTYMGPPAVCTLISLTEMPTATGNLKPSVFRLQPCMGPTVHFLLISFTPLPADIVD